jgi:hypothetical protein
MKPDLTKILSTLVSSTNQTLLFLGAVFFGLGAAGGVRYQSWFPIDGIEMRALMMVAGAVLVAVALMRRSEHSPQVALKQSDIDALKIEIVTPMNGQDVDGRVRVHVRSRGPIPDGYELMVLRGYPKQNGVVPNQLLNKQPASLDWIADSFDIAGKTGYVRTVEVWLVGRDGQALLKNWRENHEIVATLNRNIRKLGDHLKEGAAIDVERMRDWLPPITAFTADMHRCQAVSVKRV